MSMITSVACAQTSKIMRDVANLSAKDIEKIKNFMSSSSSVTINDCTILDSLIQYNNVPVKGTIVEEEQFVLNAQVGDKWFAYISHGGLGSFWLTYIVSRDKEFVGRLDIRLY